LSARYCTGLKPQCVPAPSGSAVTPECSRLAAAALSSLTARPVTASPGILGLGPATPCFGRIRRRAARASHRPGRGGSADARSCRAAFARGRPCAASSACRLFRPSPLLVPSAGHPRRRGTTIQLTAPRGRDNPLRRNGGHRIPSCSSARSPAHLGPVVFGPLFAHRGDRRARGSSGRGSSAPRSWSAGLLNRCCSSPTRIRREITRPSSERVEPHRCTAARAAALLRRPGGRCDRGRRRELAIIGGRHETSPAYRSPSAPPQPGRTCSREQRPLSDVRALVLGRRDIVDRVVAAAAVSSPGLMLMVSRTSPSAGWAAWSVMSLALWPGPGLEPLLHRRHGPTSSRSHLPVGAWRLVGFNHLSRASRRPGLHSSAASSTAVRPPSRLSLGAAVFGGPGPPSGCPCGGSTAPRPATE